jgi:hypothetical protein
VAKRKIPCPCQKSNPCRPACSLVAVLTDDDDDDDDDDDKNIGSFESSMVRLGSYGIIPTAI